MQFATARCGRRAGGAAAHDAPGACFSTWMEPCSSSRTIPGRCSSTRSSCRCWAAARGRGRRGRAGQRPHDRGSRPAVRGPDVAARGTAWLRAPRCAWRAARGARGARATRRCAPGCSAWSARHRGADARGQGRRAGAAFPAGARARTRAARGSVAAGRAAGAATSPLLDGHAVIEVKPAAHTKDSAVSAFMEEAPFRGRLPDFHRRRPDRLRRIRRGAALRRPGGRGGPRVSRRNGGCRGPPPCASGSTQLAPRRRP